MKKIIAFTLAVCMLFSTACGQNVESENLMADITPGEVIGTYDENRAAVLTDFSARLFARSVKNDANTLVSPYSVITALAMTANGAEGETLRQAERVFGGDLDFINNALAYYSRHLEGGQLSGANAIWYRESFTPYNEFLQINADFYNADIYRAPFDSSTVKDVNSFVNKNTDGMIKEIIDRIDESTVMMLINTLCFDAQWQDKYKKSQIRDGEFTAYDGSIQPAEYMYSSENVYLSDENTAGVMKYYKGGEYAFVALLPGEETDIVEYAKSLSGEKLTALFENRIYADVTTVIPQFESDYSAEMKDILKAMGMERIFDENAAELGRMGETDTNLYISTVLHKTHITVDPRGTKAAAVTLVAANETASAEMSISYFVRLDRPFVYMIVETETMLPLFVGTVLTIE